jgi:ubiquinone biosynthesis protein COQ9
VSIVSNFLVDSTCANDCWLIAYSFLRAFRSKFWTGKKNVTYDVVSDQVARVLIQRLDTRFKLSDHVNHRVSSRVSDLVCDFMVLFSLCCDLVWFWSGAWVNDKRESLGC